MSERRRGRAPSMMGKSLGVGSNSTNEGAKKKSLSRIASSASQAEGLGKQKRKKKGEVHEEMEEEDDGDFPRDEHGKKKNVIWDKDLINLNAANTIQKIREEFLLNRIPRQLRKMTMVVEKRNPNFKKIQTVGVAVPAPEDIESRPLLPPIRKGPKLDENGHVIPFSVLGSVDSYISEAGRHGFYYKTTTERRPTIEKPKVTFERSKRIKPRHIPNVDELHALQEWKDTVADRERQKTNIINRTRREPSEVIMGEARTYSNYRIIRGDVTATGILANPYTVPNRKDTRGTGFWKQPAFLGEDVNGIYESLTQTHKGHDKGTEYVGVPTDIKTEKGYIPLRQMAQPEIPFTDIPKLQGICATGLPLQQKPKTGQIQFSVRNANLEKTHYTNQETCASTVHSCPSILFGGHPVTWCDDVTEGVVVKGEVGMNGIAGERIDGCLELVNTGPTIVFYDWKKIHHKDTFNLKREHIQRFYFDSSYGVLLPGQTKYIRAIFKSPDPGIYSEGWTFESQPKLGGGGDILLTLWGIARAVDVNMEARQQLEQVLAEREATSICRGILDGVLLCLTLNDAPRQNRRKSYKWIFEDAPRVDDHFKAINTGFFYHSGVVKGLLELSPASQIESESESDVSSCDMDSVQILSLSTLKKTLESLPEEDENRDRLLWKFHRSVGKLGFPVLRPLCGDKMSIGRVLLSVALDDMVHTSQRLRGIMGISSESNIPEGMMSRIKNISKDIKGRRRTQAQLSSETAALASGKNSPGSARRKSQMIKTTTEAILKMKSVAQCKHDPLRYRNYREKMYCQTYSILGEMLEKLANQLSGLNTPTTTLVRQQ